MAGPLRVTHGSGASQVAHTQRQGAQAPYVKLASGDHISAAKRAPVKHEGGWFVVKLTRISGLLSIFCLLVFSCSCRQEHRIGGKPTAITSRFVPGQVWTFRISSNELSGAALTIVRVDLDTRLGPIIYVSVPLMRPAMWERTNTFCPFSEGALNRSVVALVRTNASLTSEDMEVFQEVYELGRRDIADGKVGKCFEITVAEVLEARNKAK